MLLIFKTKTSIFLSTQPQLNTSVYPIIKICLFATPKRRKSKDLDLLTNPRKSFIFQGFSLMYFSQQDHRLHMKLLGYFEKLYKIIESSFSLSGSSE